MRGLAGIQEIAYTRQGVSRKWLPLLNIGRDLAFVEVGEDEGWCACNEITEDRRGLCHGIVDTVLHGAGHTSQRTKQSRILNIKSNVLAINLIGDGVLALRACKIFLPKLCKLHDLGRGFHGKVLQPGLHDGVCI